MLASKCKVLVHGRKTCVKTQPGVDCHKEKNEGHLQWYLSYLMDLRACVSSKNLWVFQRHSKSASSGVWDQSSMGNWVQPFEVVCSVRCMWEMQCSLCKLFFSVLNDKWSWPEMLLCWLNKKQRGIWLGRLNYICPQFYHCCLATEDERDILGMSYSCCF